MASASAIEPSTEELLSTGIVEEQTLKPYIYIEDDSVDYFGSGSGHEPETPTWPWHTSTLETEGSGMHDYKETNFILDSSRDYESKDLLDGAISQSSLEIEGASVENILATSTEMYNIIQLEDSREDLQVISEVSESQDQIKTEQLQTDSPQIAITIRQAESSSHGTGLEKPEKL
ncbi:hypothetical protein JRQ81_019841 [Phrynocephalus forsythii]|uniref:Uncharacterized protein n=1 Tax=Phrynocephalus forsythii TaxID=171643 RepID=A0A9Q1AZ76_9SAUR|nr:hypothetical protein JRQ81_019841 [Phrynocephalus forsythii]